MVKPRKRSKPSMLNTLSSLNQLQISFIINSSQNGIKLVSNCRFLLNIDHWIKFSLTINSNSWHQVSCTCESTSFNYWFYLFLSLRRQWQQPQRQLCCFWNRIASEKLCTEHISSLVNLKYHLASTETNGIATLRGISLSSTMLDLVTVSPIQWGVWLHELSLILIYSKFFVHFNRCED